MHVRKDQIPARIDVPGAIARHRADFGDASPYGEMGGEYFSLSAGTDVAPLLKGLEGDACQAPHWGYVIAGELVVTYTDGYGPERCSAGDCFYWPAGHSVRVVEDAEVILFSPHHAHAAVIDHMKGVLASMA